MLTVAQVKHLFSYDVVLVKLMVLDTHPAHGLTGIVTTDSTMKPLMREPNGYNWHSIGS